MLCYPSPPEIPEEIAAIRIEALDRRVSTSAILRLRRPVLFSMMFVCDWPSSAIDKAGSSKPYCGAGVVAKNPIPGFFVVRSGHHRYTLYDSEAARALLWERARQRDSTPNSGMRRQAKPRPNPKRVEVLLFEAELANVGINISPAWLFVTFRRSWRLVPYRWPSGSTGDSGEPRFSSICSWDAWPAARRQ